MNFGDVSITYNQVDSDRPCDVEFCDNHSIHYITIHGFNIIKYFDVYFCGYHFKNLIDELMRVRKEILNS